MNGHYHAFSFNISDWCWHLPILNKWRSWVWRDVGTILTGVGGWARLFSDSQLLLDLENIHILILSV